ncbi:MAG TPA: hypothetical protein VK020_04360 [Microlunatus sp.]|nr:hypothetical protein [Microlunatus sp.]
MTITDATPRSVEEALRWQQERIGSTAWEGWALRFQRLAFGYATESGWARSADGFDWLRGHDLVSAGPPPRGALAWFRQGRRITVRCGLGSNKVIGPGVGGRVGIADYQNLGEYLGWSPVVFPFAR